MNKKNVKKLCEDLQKYYIERMCDLCEEDKSEDASAIYEEIREWLLEKETPKILTLRIQQNDKT